MSMDMAIIDLRPEETAAGLVYMALSWVRTLEGIAFMDGGCMTRSRLDLHSKALEMQIREDDRLQALSDAQQQPIASASNPPMPAK